MLKYFVTGVYMCRQVLGNKKGYMTIDQEYGGLENFLNWLVFERGGNGNGILFVKDNTIIKFKKDLDLDIHEIAEDIRNLDYDYALFHTRLASVGSVIRSNVHHFVYSPKFALAMNGAADYINIKEEQYYRPDMTDAEKIAQTIYLNNLEPKKSFDEHTYRTAFTGVYDGKAYMYTSNFNMMKLFKKDDAFLFSSDFPWQFYGDNIYEFVGNSPVYWEEGMPLPTCIKKTANANLLLSKTFSNVRIKDAVRNNPEVRDLVTAIFSQLEKEYDTCETIYAQKKGIEQEEIDPNTPVKKFIRECKNYKIIN